MPQPLASEPLDALAVQFPHVKVFIRHLPDRWGQTIWGGDVPVIELAHDLGRVEQRCTLAHELMHVQAGRPCTSLCPNNERDVIDATARWLLPDVLAIGRTLRRHDLAAAAVRLDVTFQVLNDRLVGMSNAETGQLAEAIETGTETGTDVRAAHGPRRAPVRGHQCRVKEPDAPVDPARSRQERPTRNV